jgi:hypothetical protein
MKGKRKPENTDEMSQIERAKYRQTVLMGSIMSGGFSGFSRQLKEFIKEDLDWDNENSILKKSYNRAKSLAGKWFKNKESKP